MNYLLYLQAEVYLNLYKQFQELGFSSDKIKEALMKFDNDGDKALDFLTTQDLALLQQKKIFI